MYLVPFHRDQDFARARIAGDDTEFGAEHVVEQHRRIAGRAALGIGAQDHLGGHRLLDGLGGRVGADVAVVGGGLRAAEMDQLGRIVLVFGLAGFAGPQRLGDDAGRGRADHGAVLGRDVVDMRRRDCGRWRPAC